MSQNSSRRRLRQLELEDADLGNQDGRIQVDAELGNKGGRTLGEADLVTREKGF